MLNKSNFILFTFLFLAVAILSAIFYSPLFKYPENIGIQDWEQFLSWTKATRVSILEYRQFPFWNPFKCGGTIQFGNPEDTVISLTTLIVLILGTLNGVKVSIIIFALIGFFGFYFLSRNYGLSKMASFFASMVFCFNGAISASIATGMVVFTNIALAPYVILFLQKAKTNQKHIVTAGVFMSLAFYFEYHIPLILGVYCVIYGVIESLILKSLRPIKNLFLFTIIFITLSLPKLVLSVQLINFQKQTHAGANSGYFPKDIIYFLTSRDQYLHSNNYSNRYKYNIDETSMYIGFVPLILSLVFFLKRKRLDNDHLILLGSLIFMLWMCVGTRIEPSLYALIKELPLIESFRVAQRFRFVFLIPLAIFAGLGLDEVLKITYIKQYALLLFLIFSLIFFGDVYTFSKDRLLRYSFPISSVNLDTNQIKTFHQRNSLVSNNHVTYSPGVVPKDKEFESEYIPWSYEYQAIKQNIGIIKCTDAITNYKNVIGSRMDKYSGEWYLQSDKGTLELEYWSPNRLVFNVNFEGDAKGMETIIINQNYYPGWFVASSQKTDYAQNIDGLIGAKIQRTSGLITFEFNPYKYIFRKAANDFQEFVIEISKINGK